MTQPTVFFLPGVGGDPAFWKPVGDLMPTTWPKHYFGWPGLGAQPPEPDLQSFDDLTRRVEAALGDAPVDLVAQSMGGVIAMELALRHPQRIRRIVLAATSGGLDVESLGADDWRPSFAQDYPGAPAWVFDSRRHFSDRLHEVRHPTLILSGNADPLSPVAVGHKLKALLPDATLDIIEDGEHDFARARAIEIAPIIERHLMP